MLVPWYVICVLIKALSVRATVQVVQDWQASVCTAGQCRTCKPDEAFPRQHGEMRGEVETDAYYIYIHGASPTPIPNHTLYSLPVADTNAMLANANASAIHINAEAINRDIINATEGQLLISGYSKELQVQVQIMSDKYKGIYFRRTTF